MRVGGPFGGDRTRRECEDDERRQQLTVGDTPRALAPELHEELVLIEIERGSVGTLA